MPARDLAAGLACVLLVGALGTAITLQGWRSNLPTGDLIPYIDSAHELIAHHRIPDRGVITSLGSYAPPGLVMVVLPGMSVLSDPRIMDVPGTVVLYIGTLIGLFLLTRTCFGMRCALWAVVLYGLSERGAEFAGSLGAAGLPGPRGHPFFYVWMACWIYWWVARRDARYLAAACLTWLVGMWFFVEVAPAALMVPAVWALYRPPLRLRPLLFAAAIAVVIWFPYLRFESGRGFADLRSQLLVQNIAPASYADALCDPTLRQRRWETPTTPGDHVVPDGRAAGFLVRMGGRVVAVTRGLVANFQGLVPGGGLLLLVVTLAGLIAFTLHPAGRLPAARDRQWPSALAIILLIGAAAANEGVLGRILGPNLRLGPYAVDSIRMLQALTALAGTALLTRRFVAGRLEAFATYIVAAPGAPQLLAAALVAPWVAMLAVIAPTREDRLVGLWPLQTVVLACVATTLTSIGGRRARLFGWGSALVIATVMLVNPLTVSRVHAWRQDGWAGRDAVEVQVVEYLARRLQADGRTEAAIGYRLFEGGPPDVPYRMVDTRWRFASYFDLPLEHLHGIANLDRCVEGLSAQDEYRVVQIAPTDPHFTYYFDVPVSGHLRLLDRIGAYEVYRRE